jgi:HEAT repeat protein
VTRGIETKMDLRAILADRGLKAKAKVEKIAEMVLDGDISLEHLIEVAKTLKDAGKGNCVEAIQFATNAKPEMGTLDCLRFATDALHDNAARVRWESAKVIGNIAHLFPGKLNKAIANLIVNTESRGTVVRWSAAFALGEIVKLKTKHNRDLVPAIEAIIKREEDNAIRKIYEAALKNIG